MTEFPAMVSPDSPSSSRDTARLVEDEGREGTSSNFWSLTFYQQLFDIDTVDVRNRLMYSMLPVPGKSFVQHCNQRQRGRLPSKICGNGRSQMALRLPSKI